MKHQRPLEPNQCCREASVFLTVLKVNLRNSHSRSEMTSYKIFI